MTTIAGWCLDDLHRNRCKSDRCTCDCHTVRANRWWGLAASEQIALAWLVRITRNAGEGYGSAAMPYASDLVALRGFERDGLAERTPDGAWRATALGFGVRDSQYDTDETRTIP